jgi:hypothetical protein
MLAMRPIIVEFLAAEKSMPLRGVRQLPEAEQIRYD